MNARVTISINILILALILVVIPKNEAKSGHLKPSDQLTYLPENKNTVSVDKAAQYVANQNANVQFIDIRTKEEYLAACIPGAINIPYSELLKKEWQGYLLQHDKTIVLYGNGSFQSSMGQAILASRGYLNIATLEGGLNKWFVLIMNSEFKSGKLSARENALYGNRMKARNLFTEVNSLPDSLKNTFLEAKLLEEEQLDGGCE